MQRSSFAGVIACSILLAGCITQKQEPAWTAAIERSRYAALTDPLAIREDDGTKQVPVLVVTTRKDEGDLNLSGDRSDRTGYGVADIVVKRDRSKSDDWQIKTIEYKSGRALSGESAFLGEVQARLTFERRDVVVFVHGYNNTSKDAAMRSAQLFVETGYSGVPVSFSWPSRARPTSYLYDLQSANFSRDELARTIEALAGLSGVRSVHLIAHSMGSWLTMEALRQLALGGKAAAMNRIATITLLAPDIDVDVFGKQYAVLPETFDNRILVISSLYDLALNLSRGLSGNVKRLGSLTKDDRLSSNVLGRVQFLVSSSRRGDLIKGHWRLGDPQVRQALRLILGASGSAAAAAGPAPGS